MRKIKRKDNFISNIIPINLFLFDTNRARCYCYILFDIERERERKRDDWENELFNLLQYIRFYRNKIEKLKYLSIIFHFNSIPYDRFDPNFCTQTT